MRKKEVKGIVVIPSNFAGQFAGKGKLQLVVHGVDTVSASSLERYIQQSVQLSLGNWVIHPRSGCRTGGSALV